MQTRWSHDADTDGASHGRLTTQPKLPSLALFSRSLPSLSSLTPLRGHLGQDEPRIQGDVLHGAIQALVLDVADPHSRPLPPPAAPRRRLMRQSAAHFPPLLTGPCKATGDGSERERARGREREREHLRSAILLEYAGAAGEGRGEVGAEGGGVAVGAGVRQAGAEGRDLGEGVLGPELLHRGAGSAAGV